MKNKIEKLIKECLEDGNDIDSINEVFMNVVLNYKLRVERPLKKKIKKSKKVCRPVLLISDSSCDDFK